MPFSIFHHSDAAHRIKSTPNGATKEKHPSPSNPDTRHVLPTYQENGRLVTKGIKAEGESGRSGFHPLHFFRIMFTSITKVNGLINFLWPFVIAAIVLYWAKPDAHVAIFAVSYVGMIPAAGLLGFAGQEFALKLPRVAGILVETLFGGIVEIVLFMILLAKHDATHDLVPVIQAAILGSILANLLLCLGACFVAGGLKHKEQKFHPVISEVGSGILLVAGFALLIPSAFYSALGGHTTADFPIEELSRNVLRISRGTSILLWIAFALYLAYSALSHDSIFDEVLAQDEENDRDRHRDLARSKFTLTECVVAILISLAAVSLLAYFLVAEIEPIVLDYHVPDNFLGLILVPLVEKVAEHLTAVDEAYDNQINFALFHCLGPTIQTALFNAPLVVIVAWGLGKDEMDLNFEIFMIVLVVLAILVVGNFLRDGSCNYLEGGLLLIVYVIIALTTFYYPDATEASSNGNIVSHGGGEAAGEAAAHARMLLRGL